jgi:hypothetical protein
VSSSSQVLRGALPGVRRRLGLQDTNSSTNSEHGRINCCMELQQPHLNKHISSKDDATWNALLWQAMCSCFGAGQWPGASILSVGAAPIAATACSTALCTSPALRSSCFKRARLHPPACFLSAGQRPSRCCQQRQPGAGEDHLRLHHHAHRLNLVAKL